MASIDKIAIVVTLAVVLVAVGVVAMANSADNAPTQQMNTDVVDARAEAAAQARADAAAQARADADARVTDAKAAADAKPGSTPPTEKPTTNQDSFDWEDL